MGTLLVTVETWKEEYVQPTAERKKKKKKSDDEQLAAEALYHASLMRAACRGRAERSEMKNTNSLKSECWLYEEYGK